MLAPILPLLVGVALLFSIAGIIASNLTSFRSLEETTNAVPAVAAILSLYLLGITAFYSILVIYSVSTYYLLDRRNNHFRRQQQLFAVLPKYIMTLVDAQIDNALRLSTMTEDATIEEENRPAGIWAVLNLFVFPIVSLIVAYNLSQDLRGHERRQQNYERILVNALNQAGVLLSPPPNGREHKRDPLLFLILTAITGGLFWIYWFYTLLKDYNEHFEDQAFFEDYVLGSLKPKSPSKQCVCQGCGGAVPADAKFCPFCGKPQQI